ncbi:hypothetical protein ABVF54_05695 [Enterococcus mundtii]|uniref:Uncharacterized protein n=1 Tax=Enterococcus mundtii TaxID=53346 RepID=A0AAI8R759_ENTMU|nr:hypothetical protein [Enterococcus mundtii]MDY4307366.1 hypothetical protein [Enterococcus mundtii]BBM13543.1 uncharacterized protein EM151A_0301 [Enterococcus mundtii]
MSKKIETIQELEEHWICLEKEFYDRIDQAIYKAGIDKEEHSEEIHHAKLRVEKAMNKRLVTLHEKFWDEGLDDKLVQSYFQKAEMSYRKPINDFITKTLNNGYLWG